jgi:transposase
MATNELFSLALGLEEPWQVTDFQFDPEKRRLDLTIDFKRGAHFSCPECSKPECAVHDTNTRTWRHLDFFQHQAYLTARVPRIQCPDCGVKQVVVPWARPGSGFTLLFEIFALLLSQQMAIAPLAVLLRVHPDSVWRILGHYVEQAVQDAKLNGLTQVGIDEVAQRKGHEYITVFGDLKQSKVVFVADTRESETIKAFADYLQSKEVPSDQIRHFCLDMWPAYLKGLEENFPNSQLIFDRYHLIAKANGALDKVRSEEAKEHVELKKTRYLWLKNGTNLSKKEKAKLTSLKQLNLKTVRAHSIVESLKEIWAAMDKKEAQFLLKKWYFWATHSRLEPIKEFAKTVRNHWDGILNVFDCYITNGIIEGLNNKIKTAMKRAYGFKTFEYLRTIIFLVAGKLALPTLS